MIEVKLLDVMGDDLAVANAARVSFDKFKEDFEDRDIKLINYLARNKHTTPFRHPQISLRCKAPIFLARQLGKHQIGLNWNEVSRRYVDTDIELYSPTSWRSRPTDGIKQGSGDGVVGTVMVDMGSHLEAYDTQDTVNKFYQNAMQMYDILIGNDVAPELARMVLPQSMMTTWIWTGSLMAFAHVYKLRIDGHAQVEAQEFASLVSEQIEPKFPVSWRALIDN